MRRCKKGYKLLSCFLTVSMVLLMTLQTFPFRAEAVLADDDVTVVVSLGDSYSAGEGIERFYGQDKSRKEQASDYDWLAHRSTRGWPTQLEFTTVDGTKHSTGGCRVVEGQSVEDGYYPDSPYLKWYFAASSGAETKHLKSKQKKNVDYWNEDEAGIISLYGEKAPRLPPQLNIFEKVEGTVDYVTMTMGGNDVGFTDIITQCVTNPRILNFCLIDSKLKQLWEDFDATSWEEKDRSSKGAAIKIKNAYLDIIEKAPEAYILIAGYPQLLEKNGAGGPINKHEAEVVNQAVTDFNGRLKGIVKSLNNDKVRFVDVEPEFNRDGGHQAYSSDPWINKIIFKKQGQDLTIGGIVEGKPDVSSAYSVHPNVAGAEAYARCVNEEIRKIEQEKAEEARAGVLSGKICKASDHTSPISGANITVYKENDVYSTDSADSSGNYRIALPVGNYRVDVTCDGYISFTAHASIIENDNNYMETFLMVQGSESDSGTATGKITNALTGNGVAGANLSVRKGWNNTENGDIITTTTTDSEGNYSLNLPLGNYTLYAEKDGFIATIVNIIVQEGTTASQNGAMTPIISGDNYRIVLTWGANPNDMDSHVVGTLTNGDAFHVYYSHKSQYDGDTEVCNLDVDNTSSYGPETITLNATNNTPYYYYVYKYSGSGTTASSESKITVYQGENIVAVFNVPTDQGSGDYWNVFAIVDGELVVRNTITDSVETSYAGDRSSRIALSAVSDDIAEETEEEKADIEDSADESTAVSEESASDPIL